MLTELLRSNPATLTMPPIGSVGCTQPWRTLPWQSADVEPSRRWAAKPPLDEWFGG